MGGAVALYLRVSSAGQAEANGVAAQRHALMRHPLWSGDALEFIDEGVSGKGMDRAGWNGLNAAMGRGEVGVVLCYDLSRAARNLRGLIEWIERAGELGVRVVFVKDGLDVDPASPMSMLVLQVMGAFAEFERKRIAGRVRDGMAARRAKGLPFGARARPVVRDGSVRGSRRISLEVERELVAALGPDLTDVKPREMARWLRQKGISLPTAYSRFLKRRLLQQATLPNQV